MSYRHIELPMPDTWDGEHRKLIETFSNALTLIDTDTPHIIDVMLAMSVGMLVADIKPGTSDAEIAALVSKIVSIRLRWALATKQFSTSERREFQ